MSSIRGNPPTIPVEVYGVEIDVKGRIGISAGLRRGDKKPSLNSPGGFDLWSDDLSGGPNGLGLGEASGLLKEL